MNSDHYIYLGKTDIKISTLGLGTMRWRDFKLPEKSSPQPAKEILDMYATSLDLGINFFDTAEVYGNGRSELHLGMLLQGKSENLVIATKFMPFPWRLSKGEIRRALVHSLRRLGLAYVNLYQMHWPFPPVPIKTWMDAMADMVADGLVRAVGVSNYSVRQVEIALEALSKHGIPLASNQIRYNLLDRRPETNGMLDYCNKAGITVISYSPLEIGILTGKYTPDNPPTGLRLWRYNRSFLEKLAPLLDELKNIGEACGGRTPAQVSLNWLIARGTVPIPGARVAAQARENAGAMGWKLTQQQVDILDEISAKIVH